MAEYELSGNTVDSAYHMSDFADYEYEPQRSNNFEVQFTGLSELVTMDKGNKILNASDTIRLAIQGSGTPSFNVDVLRIPRGNTEVKYAGKVSFDESEITLVDYIGKDVERVINAWHGLVFNPRTQNIGRANAYKKIGYLIEYSPDHKIVRQWELRGCWISKVNYGSYESSNPEVRKITATLVYDYAVLLDD